MNYSPRAYARALAELAVGKKSPRERKLLVQNFLALVKRRGKEHDLKKIAAHAEMFMRRMSGARNVVIETARPVSPSPKESLRKLFRATDFIEERVKPELVAGISVTIDDEMRFDGSLKRKLDRLFK